MNLTEAALRELCSLLSTAPPDVCARAGRAFHCRVVVKVARVPVKHLVLVRAQARQPLTRVAQLPERDASNIEDEGETPSASAKCFSGCKSAADGLAWNEEVGSAILSTLTILRMVGRAAMPRSWKPRGAQARVGAIPSPSAKF